MTPVEIFEYKLKWLPGIQVTLHSDIRQRGLDWCRAWMNPIHWKHSQWTGPYEDTFHFQKMSQAKGFMEKFPEWTKLIQD